MSRGKPPAPASATILEKRASFDMHLRTAMIYQPGWLRVAEWPSRQEIFVVMLRRTRSRVPPTHDRTEMQRGYAKYLPHDMSPERAIALSGFVENSTVLSLALGMDRDFHGERWGQPTPSFGIRFERLFE
jgi:hypothetical protein